MKINSFTVYIYKLLTPGLCLAEAPRISTQYLGHTLTPFSWSHSPDRAASVMVAG